jgi:hypothetical protein
MGFSATAAAALGAALLAVASTGASAAIVCSGNVCWHTHETYDYPADAKVIVHEDNWKWGRQSTSRSANM